MLGAELPRLDQFLQGLCALVCRLHEALGGFEAEFLEGFVDLGRERQNHLVLQLAHSDADGFDRRGQRAKRLAGLLGEIFVEHGEPRRRFFPGLKDLLEVADGPVASSCSCSLLLIPEPGIGGREGFGLLLGGVGRGLGCFGDGVVGDLLPDDLARSARRLSSAVTRATGPLSPMASPALSAARLTSLKASVVPAIPTCKAPPSELVMVLAILRSPGAALLATVVI